MYDERGNYIDDGYNPNGDNSAAAYPPAPTSTITVTTRSARLAQAQNLVNYDANELAKHLLDQCSANLSPEERQKLRLALNASEGGAAVKCENAEIIAGVARRFLQDNPQYRDAPWMNATLTRLGQTVPELRSLIDQPLKTQKTQSLEARDQAICAILCEDPMMKRKAEELRVQCGDNNAEFMKRFINYFAAMQGVDPASFKLDDPKCIEMIVQHGKFMMDHPNPMLNSQQQAQARVNIEAALGVLAAAGTELGSTNAAIKAAEEEAARKKAEEEKAKAEAEKAKSEAEKAAKDKELSTKEQDKLAAALKAAFPDIVTDFLADFPGASASAQLKYIQRELNRNPAFKEFAEWLKTNATPGNPDAYNGYAFLLGDVDRPGAAVALMNSFARFTNNRIVHDGVETAEEKKWRESVDATLKAVAEYNAAKKELEDFRNPPTTAT